MMIAPDEKVHDKVMGGGVEWGQRQERTRDCFGGSPRKGDGWCGGDVAGDPVGSPVPLEYGGQRRGGRTRARYIVPYDK